MLRRSVDENLRLRLPIESVFEIIWALSQKSGDNDKNYQSVMEEVRREGYGRHSPWLTPSDSISCSTSSRILSFSLSRGEFISFIYNFNDMRTMKILYVMIVLEYCIIVDRTSYIIVSFPFIDGFIGRNDESEEFVAETRQKWSVYHHFTFISYLLLK